VYSRQPQRFRQEGEPMSRSLTAQEIFEVAIQIERDGKVFYRRAAELFDGGIKRTVLGLAEMEEAHETFFIQLKERLFKPDDKSANFDPNGEAERYLTALAHDQVFDLNQSADETWLENSSVDDILKLAIQREKDSVVYYLGLKEVVEDALGKSKIDDIVKEEMKHISLLTQTRINLQG
jgi:rubrerythrin